MALSHSKFAKLSRRLPNARKFSGKVFRPFAVACTKKEAEDTAKYDRDLEDCFVRITPWPKNVSTEDYGEGPGFGPRYIIWHRKR